MSYRVLAIAPTSFFADYGCHVRIYEEARALGRRGHQVVICTYHNGRNPPPAPGVHVVRIPRVPWHAEVRVGSHYHKLYFDALLTATAVVRSFGHADLVHGHLHEGALAGYFASRLRRVPLVFDYQGSLTGEMIDHKFLAPESPAHRPLAWIERRIDRLADLVVTSTTDAARTLQARNPQSRAIQCLPDAVDTHVFAPPAPAVVDELRACLQIPVGRQVVGFLGLMAEYQGVGDLLYAARRIVERRPNTHFLIMGYPGLEQYRRQAYHLQILDHVTFTGRVPYAEAPQHLALLDVAVSAKLSETEGNGKLLNYMAMSLPTVAYDMPVAREILGPLGVFAPRGDVAALADRIIDLLENPDRRRQLAPALRERAEREFSWDAFGARLESLYESALRARQPVRRRWPLLTRVP